MSAPDELEIERDVEVDGREMPDSEPVCKPIGLAFSPTSDMQKLVGLVSIAQPAPADGCPIAITSSNSNLLTVQPNVVVAPGQTTAVVHAIVATASAAMQTGGQPPFVAYAYASNGGSYSPPARVAITAVHDDHRREDAHRLEALHERFDVTLTIKKLTFPDLQIGQTSVTGEVVLSMKVPQESVDVTITSAQPQIFSPQQHVTVYAGCATAAVPTLITPPDVETDVLVFATLGSDPPVPTIVKVPAQGERPADAPC